MNRSAESFVINVVGFASGMVMDNDVWRLFGYKKRPKRGNMFTKFVSEKRLIPEKFLLRELFLVCIANAIEFLNNESEDKDLILKRIIDYMLSFQDIIKAFYFTNEFEAYNYFYNSTYDYINAGIKAYNNVFARRSKDILGILFDAGWIVSFIRLNTVSFSLTRDLFKYLGENYENILDIDIVFNSEYIENS